MRNATYQDVRRVLQEQFVDLESRLGGGPMHLSMPIDGGPPRVKVSVEPGTEMSFPTSVVLPSDGEPIKLELEVVGDYLPMEAF